MFFKKIEYNFFNEKTQTKNSLYKNYTINALIWVWFLVIFILIIFNSSLKDIISSISFFFIFYWLISILTHLFKKSYFNNYTRIIQRFWKRSLYLFWLLEISLFCIYLFLTIIAPQEYYYSLENQQLFYNQNFELKDFFKAILNIFAIILFKNIIILSYKNNSIYNLVKLLILLNLFNAVFDDFLQFFTINQFYGNNSYWNKIYNSSTFRKKKTLKQVGIWELEILELRVKPYMHYTYLLIFLKLWHTIFIFMYYIFFEISSYKNVKQSYNSHSSNLQNFFFLFFFSFILKINFFKTYINYLGSFVYYWFNVNYNLYDFNYIYIIYDNKFMFYLIYDFIYIL